MGSAGLAVEHRPPGASGDRSSVTFLRRRLRVAHARLCNRPLNQNIVMQFTLLVIQVRPSVVRSTLGSSLEGVDRSVCGVERGRMGRFDAIAALPGGREKLAQSNAKRSQGHGLLGGN